MIQQMVLGFPVVVDYSVDAFMPLPANQVFRDAVTNLMQAGHGQLLVVGGREAGKTHALHVAADALGTMVVPSREVSSALMEQEAVVIDDVETVPADKHEVLFHLMQRQEGYLVLSMGVNPQQFEGLADVVSRLRVMPQVTLAGFDDHMMELMTLKLANDAQLTIRPEVMTYLLKHAERSPSALGTLIKQLDALSLQEKRAITLPLVKKALHDAV